MTSTPGDLKGCSLLAVFAHPDDESVACGGLLAWCAHLGARVSLLCATRGEDGPGGAASSASAGLESKTRPESSAEDLGTIRAQELEGAARVLGIAELVLLDYPDGCLPWVDAEVLEHDIRGIIQRIGPDVVVTFGEDGLYWHPDHIAIHARTTAAVASLGERAPALYYVTMPPGRMRAVVDTVATRINAVHSHSEVLGIGDPDAFGVLAAPPTLVVEVGEFARLKLAALRCHRTQLAESPLMCLTETEAMHLLATEHFRRAAVGSTGAAFIERLAAIRGDGPSRLRQGRVASDPTDSAGRSVRTADRPGEASRSADGAKAAGQPES